MPDAMPAGFPGAESLARRPPKDLPYCVPLEVLEANVPGAQIIGISGCSDADPDLYNNNKASGTRRCDAYYQHRIATEFMTSQPDYMPGRVYYLAALPPGYTGSEVPRKNDPKHYDRYIHGNKNGVYRSVPEFIPHFKWLQGGRQGNCTCTKCTGIATRTKPKPKSSAPKVAAPKVTAPKARARKVTDITRTPPIAKPRYSPLHTLRTIIYAKILQAGEDNQSPRKQRNKLDRARRGDSSERAKKGDLPEDDRF